MQQLLQKWFQDIPCLTLNCALQKQVAFTQPAGARAKSNYTCNLVRRILSEKGSEIEEQCRPTTKCMAAT
eukprot:5716904-Amphidinium_carterae.1